MDQVRAEMHVVVKRREDRSSDFFECFWWEARELASCTKVAPDVFLTKIASPAIDS